MHKQAGDNCTQTTTSTTRFSSASTCPSNSASHLSAASHFATCPSTSFLSASLRSNAARNRSRRSHPASRRTLRVSRAIRSAWAVENDVGGARAPLVDDDDSS